ncbi:PKD domain-containing protein [Candidatus Bipolaricaulota bacterium]|nr:PKD domain-containing protein [Candidatus Bipolaricaulota bacterium]
MRTTMLHRLRVSLVLGLLAFVVLALTGCFGGRPGSPRALFRASMLEGVIPFTVGFDGSLSFDPDGKIVSYNWDFGDDAIGSGVMVSHTFEDNGAFLVQLTVIDEHGNSHSSPLVVHALNPLPTAAFSHSREDVDFVIVREAITFDASESTDDEPIEIYTWDFGDGRTATGDKVTHRFKAKEGRTRRIVTVTLTVTDNDGGEASTYKEIEVVGGLPCNRPSEGGNS